MRKARLRKLKNSQVKNRAGTYNLYNRRGTPIYVGHSRVLRHRLLSYIEKDDYRAHRTKKKLRDEAVFYTYDYKPLKKARKSERRRKKKNNYKHNYG